MKLSGSSWVQKVLKSTLLNCLSSFFQKERLLGSHRLCSNRWAFKAPERELVRRRSKQRGKKGKAKLTHCMKIFFTLQGLFSTNGKSRMASPEYIGRQAPTNAIALSLLYHVLAPPPHEMQNTQGFLKKYCTG